MSEPRDYPSGGTCPWPEIYFERQRFSLCAQHVLNMLFQSKVFDVQRLNDICHKLTPKKWFRRNPHKRPSFLGGGNYDANVVEMALLEMGYSTKWIKKDEDISKLPLETYLGVIVNEELALSRHWFCVKVIGGTFYSLDSLMDAPVAMKSRAEADYFLNQLRTSGATLILVIETEVMRLMEAQSNTATAAITSTSSMKTSVTTLSTLMTAPIAAAVAVTTTSTVPITTAVTTAAAPPGASVINGGGVSASNRNPLAASVASVNAMCVITTSSGSIRPTQPLSFSDMNGSGSSSSSSGMETCARGNNTSSLLQPVQVVGHPDGFLLRTPCSRLCEQSPSITTGTLSGSGMKTGIPVCSSRMYMGSGGCDIHSPPHAEYQHPTIPPTQTSTAVYSNSSIFHPVGRFPPNGVAAMAATTIIANSQAPGAFPTRSRGASNAISGDYVYF